MVEGRAGLEPGNLALVEGVVEGNLVGGAVGVVDNGRERLARGKLVEANNGNLGALGGNEVVVIDVGKGEGKQALLLEVCLVDAGKALDNDGAAAEVAWLEGSVFAGRALAVVVLANDAPGDGVGLVRARNVWHALVLASELVLDGVGLTVGAVDGTNQHVVGDVVQVAAVLEPGAGHRDVVGRALALDLDQNLGFFFVRVGGGARRMERQWGIV